MICKLVNLFLETPDTRTLGRLLLVRSCIVNMKVVHAPLHCIGGLIEQGKILFRHFERGPDKQIETVLTVLGPKFTAFYF